MLADATSRLLTPDEVAKRLGVHRVTVYRMVQDGRLPASRLGRRGCSLRIPEEALMQLLFGEENDGAAS